MEQGREAAARPSGQDRLTGLSAEAETELFRSISLSSRNGVVAADHRGVILWANEAVADVWGWTPAELVGRPVTDLADAEAREHAFEWHRRVLAGEVVEDLITTTGLRRDGSRFPLALTASVRRGPADEVLGLSFIGQDRTEELAIRQELTEALARSHARFDQVAQPQALLDLEARFVAVNDAACALLGWPRHRLLGRNARELVDPIELPAATARLERLARGDAPSITYEVVATRGDHSQVPLHLDISLVRDAAGKPRELAVFARDLSELQQAEQRLRDQDAFFRALYRSAADPAMVSDEQGRFRYVSPSFARVFGYRAEDIVGHDSFSFVHPEDLATLESMRRTALASPFGASRGRLRARDVRERYRWFDVQITNCLEDRAIGGLVANLREITAEMEAQERLSRSEARYRAIVETAQEGIVLLAPDGSVMFANDKLGEILGVSTSVLYVDGLFASLDESDRLRLEERLHLAPDLGPEHHEATVTHPDGTRRVVSITASPLTDDDGRPIGSLYMVADVTVERQAEAELRHAALHDGLTGLPNRSLLVDRLTMAAARQARDDRGCLAVLFLDLDHFKLINDSRGHETGDRVLRDAAARLEQAVRETDTVARIGGDEFAIVCEDSSEEEAQAVAHRVLEVLTAPFVVDGEQLYIGASVGIACSPPYRADDLLRFADAAMYHSKTAGRSQVTVYQGGELLGSERRLALAGGLREALVEETLTLGYQPIVDLADGRLLGLEALLRWAHPTLGPVSPDEVVAAAEATGLSFDLDRAVIRRSGRDLLALRRDGLLPDDVYVSVNISSRTAQQQRLDGLVRDMLEGTGLPPSCLSLEITEHAIMDNADHAVVLLTRLGNLGVGIAIDDFGTGYNSLVHLQRLPVRTLKIDRSFVGEIGSRAESLAIARSVVSLAAALGMGTIAEGVETTEQAELLQQIGCTAGQGYLWSPAATVAELPEVLGRLAGAPA